MAKRFAFGIVEKEYDYLNIIGKVNGYDGYSELSHNLVNFNPAWLESNFQKKFPKKSKRIFINSMSDIAYWKPEWMEKVLEKIIQYPQHTFIFLTKQHEIYRNHIFRENCWLGVTVNNEYQTCISLDELALIDNITFVSIEPIQEKINKIYIGKTDWLIIGAETGNRKDKIIPKPEWIQELVGIDIPLFMKDNLKPYWNGKFRQEFPK
jgi:protein gp37